MVSSIPSNRGTPNSGSTRRIKAIPLPEHSWRSSNEMVHAVRSAHVTHLLDVLGVSRKLALKLYRSLQGMNNDPAHLGCPEKRADLNAKAHLCATSHPNQTSRTTYESFYNPHNFHLNPVERNGDRSGQEKTVLSVMFDHSKGQMVFTAHSALQPAAAASLS